MSRVVEGVKTHVRTWVRGWKQIRDAFDPEVLWFMLWFAGVMAVGAWPFFVGLYLGPMFGVDPIVAACGGTGLWWALFYYPYIAGAEE